MASSERRLNIKLWQGVVIAVFIVVDLAIIALIVGLIRSAPASPAITGTDPAFVDSNVFDPSIDYCNDPEQAIRGDGCCNLNVENTDNSPNDCPCSNDGVCSDGEGVTCEDCGGIDQRVLAACGEPCADGKCPNGLTCGSDGLCGNPEICPASLPQIEEPAQGPASTDPTATSPAQDGQADDGGAGNSQGDEGGASDDDTPATPTPYSYGAGLFWDDPFVTEQNQRLAARGAALTAASTALTLSVFAGGAFIVWRQSTD